MNIKIELAKDINLAQGSDFLAYLNEFLNQHKECVESVEVN